MSAPTLNITDLIETSINLVEDVRKLIRDLTRPTKVGLNNLWNKLRENTANIPNPTYIGGQFELSICNTNGSEWLSAEMGRINREIFEIAETARATDNAKPKAPDTLIIIYTCATETDCEPYPKLMNPRRFVIDTLKSSEVITIEKIKHNMKLKEYAAYTVVDSAVQHFLQKVFELDIFADMHTNDNFVLNKSIALQMRQHLTPSLTNLIPTTSKMK